MYKLAYLMVFLPVQYMLLCPIFHGLYMVGGRFKIVSFILCKKGIKYICSLETLQCVMQARGHERTLGLYHKTFHCDMSAMHAR